jgi:hypothetical protein
MTAHCSNDVSASTTVGSEVPGEGTITLPSTCVPPIVVSATGAGKMRPLGAKADGTEDIAYDPNVNLPISNIFDAPPATGTSVTANPVTTLVTNVVQSGLSIADAKAKVEAALGMDSGDADKDYRDPNVAEASVRLAFMTALASEKLTSAGHGSDGKPLGQLVADTLVAGVITGSAGALQNASGIALALKDKVDVTTDLSVTGGEIDNDSLRVYNMLVNVQNLDGRTTNVNVPVTLADMSNQLASSSDAALHLAEINKVKAATEFVQKVLADPTSLQTAATALKSAQDTANALLASLSSATPVVRVSTTTTSTSATQPTTSTTTNTSDTLPTTSTTTTSSSATQPTTSTTTTSSSATQPTTSTTTTSSSATQPTTSTTTTSSSATQPTTSTTTTSSSSSQPTTSTTASTTNIVTTSTTTSTTTVPTVTTTTLPTKGCAVTVPNTDATKSSFIDTCYMYLTEAQCSSAGISVWDAESAKLWANKTVVTYSWVALTGTTKLYCDPETSNGEKAQDYRTLPVMDDVSGKAPVPEALPVLVKN